MAAYRRVYDSRHTSRDACITTCILTCCASLKALLHSGGGDTNRRSCMGWRLNVCITVVSRSGADSHHKITYAAVLCLLSCAFNWASVSWRFLQSVQRFQFFIRFTLIYWFFPSIFTVFLQVRNLTVKFRHMMQTTRYQSDVTTTQHQLHHVPLNISWSVS